MDSDLINLGYSFLEEGESICEIHPCGDKRWYKKGTDLLHRIDGPALEWASGGKSWYQEGKHHRLDGPARTFTSGTKHWYKEDLLHREDGPALECANGDREWWYNGKRHREDGPAFIQKSGAKEYWHCGQKIAASSDEEYKRLLKLKAFW